VARTEERFLIWGGGGHGKVVADLVRSLGHELLGFVDAATAKLDQVVEPGGARVICTELKFLHRIDSSGAFPAEATAMALGIGSNAMRHQCLRRIEGRNVPALIHPAAVVSPSARCGAGTVVMPNAVINADARIGAGCIINTGAVIEHDCEIGDGAHISPGAILAGAVRVRDRCWIGGGAMVIPGREIGADSVVGAGAVVLRDLPGGAVVAGNPARLIHQEQ
jgi:sugar O-acyltransferase (sialic acid O-acetyltransferase NeuD family)